MIFLSLLVISIVTPSPSQDSNLVALYLFEGNADDAISGLNGTVDGPILSSDRFGNENGAYEFDGIDDQIRILDDSLLHLSGDFALAVWFMPYTIKDGTLFRKNSSQNAPPSKLAYGVGVAATGHHTFTIGTDESADGVSSQGPLLEAGYVLNEWNLIIAQKEGDRITLRTHVLDSGSFKLHSKTTSGSILYDGAPFLIGTRSRLEANTFHGKIDEIKIYNKFKTIEEITGISLSDETTSTQQVEQSPIDIYPNPFSNQINIQEKEKSSSISNLEIININGVSVWKGPFNNTTEVITQDFETGIYFLRFTQNNVRYTTKLIKL